LIIKALKFVPLYLDNPKFTTSEGKLIEKKEDIEIKK